MTTFGELVKSAVSGVVFIYFGMLTAPKAKTVVAGVLAVLWYMLQLYWITLERSSVWMLLNLICSSLAPLFVLRYFINQKEFALGRTEIAELLRI